MVKITQVEENSRAARAGVQVGDVLVAINQNEIADVLDYRFYLAERHVTLSLSREGEPFEVTMGALTRDLTKGNRLSINLNSLPVATVKVPPLDLKYSIALTLRSGTAC